MRTVCFACATSLLIFGAGCSSSGNGTGGAGGQGANGTGTGTGTGNGTGSGTASTGSGMPTVGGIFEQPEPWTKDVSALAPDTRSDAIIAALAAAGGWGNGNVFQIDFSIPLFFADASTPRATVTGTDPYCFGGPDCDSVPLQIPTLPNGNTEGSNDYACDPVHNDCHMLVVETSEKKLYELYNTTGSPTSFVALGAFVWDLTKAYPDNLRGDQCTSADAAGFPIAALLPTADEVAAGEVKHALRFILPASRMKQDVYVHPATHSAGTASTDPNGAPYGVRLRRKASFDESPYNAGEKVILHALKKYGMLLSDGGDIALTFADDRLGPAKWANVGISAQSFNSIGVDNFEVVDLGPEITLTDNCVRNP
jgi:hypothetical protein